MPTSSSPASTTEDPTSRPTTEPAETIEGVETPGFLPPPRLSRRPSSRTNPDPPSPSMTVDPNGASDGGGSDDLPPPWESSSTEGPAGPSPVSTDPDVFVGVVRQLVGLVSIGVRFARERRLDVKLPMGVWLADDEDAANIGDPLARIAARHTPLAGGAPSDVADGIEAMLGTAAYGVKHLEIEQLVLAEMSPGVVSSDHESDDQ